MLNASKVTRFLLNIVKNSDDPKSILGKFSFALCANVHIINKDWLSGSLDPTNNFKTVSPDYSHFFWPSLVCWMSKQKRKNNLCTKHVLNFMYWTSKSTKNLLLYYGLVVARISAFEKGLPVPRWKDSVKAVLNGIIYKKRCIRNSL